MTAGDDQGRPLAWRSLLLRVAITAIPASFTIAVLVLSTTRSEKLLVGLTLGLTLASPAHGLLIVTALAPLGRLLGTALSLGTFRLSEALVVAFMTGWMLRAPGDRHGPRVPATIGWLLATSIVASVVGLAWQLSRYPGLLEETLNLIAHAYYLVGDRIGFVDAARLLEGVALVIATTTLFRGRPSLAVTLSVALAAPAVLAAASSVLLWLGIGPADAVAKAARIGYRFSGHVTDVNAAGSYFAMTLCLALGLALRERRTRRVIWMGAAGASLIGLWFSESRSGLWAAVIVITLASGWIATIRFKPIPRVSLLALLAAMVLVVLVVVASGTVRVRQLKPDSTDRAATLREQFNTTSMRMIETRPITGVGIGQYYRLSPLFLTPPLAFTYRAENAHNYFLQVGAELGLVGLTLFVAWIGVPLAHAGRALASRPPLAPLANVPRDWRLLGAACGVSALLGTCLTGHPLLIDEVAFPFWIQLGLTGALAGSTLLNSSMVTGTSKAVARASRALSAAAAVAGVGIVASTLGSVARGDVNPSQSQAVDGLYGWETAEVGTRFRWTSLYGSVFVPADVTRVYIPLRLPTSNPALSPIGVEMMGGAGPARTWIGESWTILNVTLPDAIPPTRFKRIDLKIDRTWQPALYIAGSRDVRSVGVQVGECRLFHEH